MNLDLANERLHYLGWKDFQLDEHTYQLVIACFEDEQLDTFKSMPTEWFENEFSLETNK